MHEFSSLGEVGIRGRGSKDGVPKHHSVGEGVLIKVAICA